MMTIDVEQRKQDLVNLLGSAAMYNDKGIFWTRHSPEKIEEMRHHFQQKQIELAQVTGFDVLGDELTIAIESGTAARDDLGVYVSLAEQLLGVRRKRP